jgi:hypothetical protein
MRVPGWKIFTKEDTEGHKGTKTGFYLPGVTSWDIVRMRACLLRTL